MDARGPDVSTPYNRVVRLIAAILLAILTSAMAVDPWCCPDGCTAEVEHASQSADEGCGAAQGDCILCLGGIEAPPDTRRSSRLVERDIAPRRVSLFVDIVLLPTERPPRS